jgi:hypothetical protein
MRDLISVGHRTIIGTKEKKINLNKYPKMEYLFVNTELPFRTIFFCEFIDVLQRKIFRLSLQ